jgi:hypothetical protein
VIASCVGTHFGLGDVEGVTPRLDIDVRRRCRGQRERAGDDPDPGDITDEGDVVAAKADVMGGVPRRVGDLVAVEDHLASAQRTQVGRRHRGHLPPQPRHRIAIDPLGTGDQARWIGEMAGPALVDVDGQLGPTRDERAGAGRVVEVDVGEQQRRGTRLAQAGEQCRQRRRRSAVDEHVAVQPRRDRPRATLVHEVDDAHQRRRSGVAAVLGGVG